MKRITYVSSIFAVIVLALSAASAQNTPAPMQGTSTSAAPTSAPTTTTQSQPVGAQSQPVGTAGGQNSSQAQDQPLGDYARKVHKPAPAAKAAPKVFDNDNIPMDDKISVVGQPADQNNIAPGPTQKPADAKDSKSGNSDADKQAEWKQWQDKISAQKNQIDLDSRELDVLQKEYQLRAAAMYGDAGNRLRNSGEWDKEDADYKQKIADKQKAVDDAKQKLDDMQEEARKAGVPSSMSE
jgi:hypothetical protein